MNLKDRRIVVTGGTGSMGKTLVRRLLTGEMGLPSRITVFSRDEAKQWEMKREHPEVDFVIGDIRNYDSLVSVLRGADVVVNAAAMKQVPACEYNPYEAIRTNILGAENIVRAISENELPVDVVVGVSTDKACKPVNAMGMTKALQERVFLQGNLRAPHTRFVCVRYGNVLASRGSVIPLFHKQIREGGPVTITDGRMTRFLMTLDHAVDTVFAAITWAQRGETVIPEAPSAIITDLAAALIDGRDIEIIETGIRPGEKLHEILVSEDEAERTVLRHGFRVVRSHMPELRMSGMDRMDTAAPPGEFSSADTLLDAEAVRALLVRKNLMIEHGSEPVELLR
jgi:FlaA1/EpsC-like NDP-sugar epimerase